MSVNLAINYSKKIDEAFTASSFLAGKASRRYEFTGVKGLRIYTPMTVPLNDYNRVASGNRYGTPTEMQDTVQELVMRRDRSFSLIIDKGNNMEQLNTKEAGRMLRMEIDERVVPEIDAYTLKEWATNAGKIVPATGSFTKSNIIEQMGVAAASLDDELVPNENRYIGITPAMYNLIRLSPEFVGIEALGKGAIEKGVVGELFGAKIVKLPTRLFPENVNFIAWYKGSVLQPQKISDARTHENPPGISGHLLEGRWNYDAFVLSAKANGVYVSVAAGTQQAAPTVTPTATGFTVEGDGIIYYTTDGSDPRYSAEKKLYSGEVTLESGKHNVRAVSTAEGKFNSDLGTAEVTIA